jgi:hypothetical protein
MNSMLVSGPLEAVFLSLLRALLGRAMVGRVRCLHSAMKKTRQKNKYQNGRSKIQASRAYNAFRMSTISSSKLVDLPIMAQRRARSTVDQVRACSKARPSPLDQSAFPGQYRLLQEGMAHESRSCLHWSSQCRKARRLLAVLRTARTVVRGHSTDGSFVLDVVLPVSKLPVISSSVLPNFVLRLRAACGEQAQKNPDHSRLPSPPHGSKFQKRSYEQLLFV